MKSKEKANKILEEILKKYSEDVITYYLETDTLPLEGTKDIELFIRSVIPRGGSKQTIIPPEVAEYLGIEAGKHVAFVLNRKIGKVYLKKPTYVLVSDEQRIRVK